MKILGWALIIGWSLAVLYLLSGIIGNTSTDIYGDLIGIAVAGLQIYFNYRTVRPMK